MMKETKKLSDDELIKNYLHSTYSVTTSEYNDSWMAMDKFNGTKIPKMFLIRTMGKLFYKIESTHIVNDWLDKGASTMETKLKNHLEQYKLVIGNKRIAWVIINLHGKEFTKDEVMKELMLLLPKHINDSKIARIFDDWFTEMKYVGTKDEIGC